ncbi:hypothetical protein GCM10007890_10320 [Methylobacterium tardum]|uniref:Tetratricopeptide repeat protein n=1 Tax=Methylobacterium tardum TaxID=374432 RepID=A0AA37T8S4_9HYPH|nr:hypothetical protein GCM10007890_10320 [Methylobacterium tardum]
MNLGIALEALEEQGSGTARLEAAVETFDACLRVAASVWPPNWVGQVCAVRDLVRAEIEWRGSAQDG